MHRTHKNRTLPVHAAGQAASLRTGRAATTRTVTRAALYLRISQDREGRELGVQRQEDDCRALAARLGVQIVAVYADNDVSASTRSKKRRPDYERMIADAKARRFDMIIAYTSGRLTRRPLEHEGQIELAVTYRIEFRYVASPDFDLNTAAGRRIARTLAAQDAGESEDISERVTREKAQAKERGDWISGSKPFGYERDGIVIREREAALIRDAIDRVPAGVSLRSIAAEWQRACPPAFWTAPRVETLAERAPAALSGGELALWHEAAARLARGDTPRAIARDFTDRAVPVPGARWTGGRVREILCNPRNAALIEFPGQAEQDGETVTTPVVIPAAWPAIVTEDQWRGVVAFCGEPSRRRAESNSRVWLGSGEYRCGRPGCGATMRSSTAGIRGNKWTAYRCRAHNHLSIPAAEVDLYVHDMVAALLARQGADLIMKTPTVDVSALRTKANTYRLRLDEAADAYADGESSKAEWLRIKERITANLAAVEAELAAVMSGSVLGGVADAPDPADAYRALADQPGGVDRQRAIVAELVTVTILPGQRGRAARGGVDLDRVRIIPRMMPDMVPDVTPETVAA